MIPLPTGGEVHIRRASLDLDVKELAEYESFLTPDERKRADRYLNRNLRNRFVAGRGFLRETLSLYLDIPPDMIVLALEEQGKPFLADNSLNYSLQFNLSHTGGEAILAVTGNCRVGVDLERVRDNLAYREIARRFFSRREQEELFALPPSEHLDAFFRCWTRKEAYIKGCGTGFSQPADGFAVSLRPDEPPALLEHRDLPLEPLRWRLADLQVPAGYRAALALEGVGPDVRYVG
jgi:4'-phosphopantetheinyl transferase